MFENFLIFSSKMKLYWSVQENKIFFFMQEQLDFSFQNQPFGGSLWPVVFHKLHKV